jgi:hypothetical protein
LIETIVRANAVGIKPRMELDMAFMCLREHKGKGIISRISPLGAG